jgi:flagellar M-ring protein FliF
VPKNDIRGLLGRGKDLAGRLTPVQKIGLGAVVLTVIAGSLLLGRTATSTSMSPLYADLQSEDASAVVDALTSRHVAYSLTDAGHTVLVPTDQVYDLRVSLAGAGLPSSSQGYSLLDKQGITTSDYRQRIDYQRALEGELDKTLGAMDGIQSASVHLALPEESVFVDTPSNPTASVLLIGNSLDGINSDTVDAVVHLVASSVKNMKPADVTVIDSAGEVLSTAGADGQAASGSSGRNKAVSSFENSLGAELTSLLSRTTGAGKVAVSVSADLDLDQVQSTSEDYGPIGTDGGTYVISEQVSNENYAGTAENGSTGILGPDGSTVTATSAPAAATTPVTTIPSTTATTIPGATTVTTVPTVTTPTVTATGSTATTVPGAYGSSTGNRTYAIDRVVQQVTTAPGKIMQLHVAVLLDDKAVTADQATAIEQVVATAAGIDAARGDTVTVSRLPFDTSAQTEAATITKADKAAAAKDQMMQLIRTLAIVLVVIIALLLAARSARRARRLTATPINIGELAMARRGAISELASAMDEVEMMPIIPDRNESTMGEIAAIADRRPEDVANVLRSWLADSQARH